MLLHNFLAQLTSNRQKRFTAKFAKFVIKDMLFIL